MSELTNGWDARYTATYRVLLKRPLRVAGLLAAGTAARNEPPTADLERDILALARHAPRVVADAIERQYTAAGRAWERGNNSGSSETLEREHANCDRLQAAANAVLYLFGVTTDFPGLYPIYHLGERAYYTAEAAFIAWRERESQK